MNRSNASRQAEGTVIIGGGIAGLATAIALRNIAGVNDIHILEASSQQDFQNINHGAAMFLGPNGLKALQAIGGVTLTNEVIEKGTRITGNEIMLPGQSMVIPDTAEQKTGLPNVMIGWGILRSLLQKRLSSETKISYDKQITAEHLKSPSFNQATLSMVIAADGIYSSFGPMIRGEAAVLNNLKDNGRVNVKAVAPMDMPNHCGRTKAAFAPDRSVACFAGPAGEGYTYWAISFADSESDGMITHVVDESDDLSHVKQKVLEILSSNEAFAFASELIAVTDPSKLFVRRSAESVEIGPSLTRDKVVLVGDAAHAMSASYGQCPNFALEDAATLGWCIRDGTRNLHAAMDDYSNARVDRCSSMADKSSQRVAQSAKGQSMEDVWDFVYSWDPPSMADASMQVIA